MKRIKRMLSMFLVIGLLITAIPVQARAETPAGQQIADYQVFLENLSVLEEYAADYAELNPGKDPAALTIGYIRAGVDAYNTGFWGNLAGYEDYQFAAYVRNRENADLDVNVTGLQNLAVMQTPNGDSVDMARLFAVVDACYANGGEAGYADVAGWAADLVDLMVLADASGLTGTLEELMQKLQSQYFLKNGFTQAEFFADLDGYAIARELMSAPYHCGTIGTLIRDYYGQSLTNTQRVARFLEIRFDAVTARSDIRNAVFQAYTDNERIAALESSQNFASEHRSDLRRACCYVFADYLCALAGDQVEWNDNRYYSVVDSEKVTLTSGVTQETYTATTSDDKQIVYYLATADVSNPYVGVYVNYNNNDPSQGWGMQTVRDQAYAAEARHSNPANESLYIPNYNVVVAINGAGYNMTTGEPAGLMMMEGVEYHAPDNIDHGGYGFFGILKDGSAVIGSTQKYYDLKAQGLISEGIDVFGTTLVKDGQLAVAHSDSHTRSRASRTAIGITRTGKVVVMTLDGRQEPISCGGSMQEIAQIMLDAGCVDAINLDGGGSTTFLAQKPGDEDLSLINRPSDGFERSVSASLIIVSTMPALTDIDHAQVDSDVDYLTVDSQVQMNATGIHASGEEMALPAGASWSVSDSQVASISAAGVLTGKKTGQVEVKLMLNGSVLGSKTMHVVVPDAVYFETDTMNVVRGEAAELPVGALYAGQQVAIRSSDVAITLSNQAGTVSGFRFTAAAGTNFKSVVVTAALAQNPMASDTMTIALYGQDETSFDFNQATAGDVRLAWLRQVSNATTGDGLTYRAADGGQTMTTGYTLAFDAAKFPLDPKLQSAIYDELGIPDDEAFLLRLAGMVGADSTVTVKLAMDSGLSVDTSKIALTSDLFTLEKAELDSATNTLTLKLRWKAQTAPVNKETTSTICILTGICAEPKASVARTAQPRQDLANEITMTYAIVLESDDLYARAEELGLQKHDDGTKGVLLSGGHNAGKDTYTLLSGPKNGWIYEDGGYAYYANGTRYTGVRKVGQFYYDFGQNGINVGQTKYTGLFLENGARRYTKDGVLTPGWYIEGDAHYYFDENGTGYNGAVTVDEVEMKFDNGLHIGGYTGFVTKSDGNKYHYTNGRMDYGWVYVDEDLYHFSTDTGVMTTGTHVSPDDEARAKGAYYDFAPDGRTLRGYFNGFGYYYWAGVPRRNDWVKSGADPDPDAWYRTNNNGHYVTDGTGKETFDLVIGEKTYKAVKIDCDGVVYTFDTTNGKLLKGDFVLKNSKWYYYWAGKPVNNGWFEIDGKTYYAYADGHLATGIVTIDGETYMFKSQGALVTEGPIMTAEFSTDYKTMTVKIVDAEGPAKVRLAVWAVKAGQAATMVWYDMEETSEGTWEVDVPLCRYGSKGVDTYEMHAYSIGQTDTFLVASTIYVPRTGAHVYTDIVDGSCNACGINRADVETRVVVHMFRMYNPNTGEHFYTGSTEERDNLIAVGWQYEGIGFTFPANTGAPVHRLFQPSTGEHLYTMDEAEKDKLMAEGWNYEGIAFNSAFDTEAVQHRLHNPNASVGAYHFTFSIEERDNLIAAGWEYQGIGWYSCWK